MYDRYLCMSCAEFFFSLVIYLTVEQINKILDGITVIRIYIMEYFERKMRKYLLCVYVIE